MTADTGIEMPANAYFFFLKSIPCDEPFLYPHHTVNGETAAREYIGAREFWRREGLASMDLDGGLTLTEEAGKLAWPFFRLRALLRWEHDGLLECFARGPVGLVWMRQEEGKVTLSLRPGGFAIERMREELLKKVRGELVALLVEDGSTAKAHLDGLLPESAEFNRLMEEQMALFYCTGDSRMGEEEGYA